MMVYSQKKRAGIINEDECTTGKNVEAISLKGFSANYLVRYYTESLYRTYYIYTTLGLRIVFSQNIVTVM